MVDIWYASWISCGLLQGSPVECLLMAMSENVTMITLWEALWMVMCTLWNTTWYLAIHGWWNWGYPILDLLEGHRTSKLCNLWQCNFLTSSHKSMISLVTFFFFTIMPPLIPVSLLHHFDIISFKMHKSQHSHSDEGVVLFYWHTFSN